MADTILTDDGVRIAVERHGAGPPFLMLHGFTGAKEDFADHAPRFGEHTEVVLFDHRGHGASDKPRDLDAYSLDRLAADTLAVADALGIDQFVLLGHSMGGMVARRVVLDHPERVAALVLLDTSPGPPKGIDASMAEWAAQIALTDGMTALRAILDEADVLGTPADQRVRRERPGYIEFNERKWAAVSAEAYAALARAIVHQPDDLERLRTVSCPTLVVVGEQDEPFLEVSAAMAEVIPGARHVVVPDAGHSPQFENPDAYFETVDGFLREALATRSVTS